MGNSISGLGGVSPIHPMTVDQDSKLEQSGGKEAVKQSMKDLASVGGDFSKLNDQQKAEVEKGDKAFNDAHGTHVDHSKPKDAPEALGG